MRILRFNESLDNSNSDYRELVDTLQVEIFDEYNINQLEEDDYDEYHESGQTYPYWEYSYDSNGSDIRQINIINITQQQTRDIMNELMNELPSIIYGRTGIRYQCESFIDDDIMKPTNRCIRIYIVSKSNA